MGEDKLPKAASGDPGEGPDGGEVDLLARAAREIRGAPALQALVPLSPAEREQLADAAIDRVLGSAAGPPGEPAGAIAALPAAGRRPRLRVRSVVAGVAAAVALAAGIALYLHDGQHPAEPLVAYAMVVAGEQRTRGAGGPADAPVEIRPETRLVVTLTPERPERDALLRLVVVRDGRASVLDPPIARAQAGRFEIAGPAADLLAPAGDGPAELVVVLGRALPGDDEIRALALGAPDHARRDLQVIRRAIVLVGFSHAAVDVLLGGCSAVLAPAGAPGPAPLRCEVASGARLHLWIGARAEPGAPAGAEAGIALALDGQPVDAEGAPRGGGSAFDVDVPARAGRLSVRMAGQEIAAWQLAPAPVVPEVRASDEARRAGRLDEAAAALEAVSTEASGAISAEERLEIVRRRAKLDRLRGDTGRERARREQAVALARSLGHLSAESDETVAILYGLMDDHALAEAAQLLPALDAHGTAYAEGAVRRELVRGMLASELGDLGTALAAFQRSLALAERIADQADRAMVLGPMADVLQSLGRGGEVAALIDAEIERGRRDGDVCARVDAITNAGWLLRDADPVRAQRLVDQAVQLADQHCAHRAPIARVNQGWLLATGGRFGDARAVLDQLAARPQAPADRIATWTLRLEAEIVLGQDPAAAERHARHLAARAAELCSSELAYEAHLLRARALVALDRPGAAARAFADADRALTLWSRLVPLGEGREAFFERHDRLALEAIPFFLGRIARGVPGAPAQLAITVRRSIARFVGSLAGGGRARARAEHGDAGRDRTSKQFERTLARWPAPAADPDAVAGVCEVRDAAAQASDEPALTEGPRDAALLVHPSPRGLVVVAWRRSAIEVAELPGPGAGERPRELADRIAAAAAPMLALAPRVDLHVHRSLAALALDRSLAARLAVPVAFAVDVPARPPAARCAGEPRALLVVNPQHNLWAASDAAPALRSDLARIGFAVDTLEGAAATRAAIEAHLADPCTQLFHYDGHGIAAPARAPVLTRDRSDDALVLAGGDRLTAADVLGLPHAPAVVVLNGCTTAAPEGLGLAQAFLLGGASQVIASLDELPADDAARFARALFATAPAGTDGIDLAQLFARATAGADLPALRVYER
ncbi:MAG TPA: CHAT domain-containing protein [Kofleriaceae bacterium]|jgi:tetratricopeptide (TPR) repeat protein|nr:CHAT domain-containing protein [Kofleriaceae bacterium]